MGIFGKGKGGGLMNVIRCDEEEYLVWKWRPLGQEVNSTTRENAIRYGSSLRVKNGEVAVFRYKQKDGQVEDYIEGPMTTQSRLPTSLCWRVLWEWHLAGSHLSRPKSTISTPRGIIN